MHRASDLASRRTLRYVVPLAVLTVLGLVFGRSLLGSSPDSALASAPYHAAATGLSATGPAAKTTVVATAAAAAPITSLGTKHGVITLTGPRTAAKGTLVIFVLDGAKRVLRTDATAPFAVKVNTKALPNGRYTLSALVVRVGSPSVVTTRTLRIKNVAAAKPKPKPAPSTPAPTSTKPSGGGGGAAPSSVATQILDLVNVERAKAGCGALTLNSKLTAAAQAHTTDMATHNFFSHDSQDGRSPFDRIKAAGYSFSAAAENIAAGSTTAAGAMDQWMHSAGHKANILNCTYVHLGVGYAKGVKADYAAYWTQDFGKPL